MTYEILKKIQEFNKKKVKDKNRNVVRIVGVANVTLVMKEGKSKRKPILVTFCSKRW